MRILGVLLKHKYTLTAELVSMIMNRNGGQEGPWSRKLERRAQRCLKEFLNFGSLDAESREGRVIEVFRRKQAQRMIFESNQLEGAGPQTFGETRKVLERFSTDIKMPDIENEDEVEEFVNRLREPDAVVSFEGRTRSEREVLQHHRAYDIMHILAAASRFEALKSLVNGIPVPPERRLITEVRIQHVHRLLAEGLMPHDAGVSAGEYRIDDRSAGTDFPDWKSIQGRMTHFVKEANSRVHKMGQNISRSDVDAGLLIRTAAWVSHSFVWTHPFPDFNGRMSRLLANLVLDRFEVPFPIVLRQKGGAYLKALQRADDGDLGPYAALIAKSLVSSFEKLNDKFEDADLDPFLEEES